MRSRLFLAGSLATLTLLVSFHASGLVPVLLDCKAGGVADYWGDYEGGDRWVNIVANGECLGGGVAFEVRLTGSGGAPSYERGVAKVLATLRLTNPATGSTTSIRQAWLGPSFDCRLNEMVIRGGNGVPVGLGSVNHCAVPLSDPPFTQDLTFRWKFHAWALP